MTVYDDIEWSAPTLSEINAMCLAYPIAARLRNSDATDLGAAEGTHSDNRWLVQPAASNGDCSPVINYVLQEASRIGGIATIEFTRGDFYLHSFIHCPDPIHTIKGNGKRRTIFNWGQYDGTYADILSRTPADGATYSDAEIFSLLGFPAIYFYSMNSRYYRVSIKDLTIKAHSDMSGRVGAKLYADGSPSPDFSSATPDWDNLHTWASLTFLGYLDYATHFATLDTAPEIVIPVAYPEVRVENIRFEGGIGDYITEIGHGLNSMGGIQVHGHTQLTSTDPLLVNSSGFWYAENGDGILVANCNELSPISGDYVISKCEFVNCSVGPAINCYNVMKKPPNLLNYALWDFGNMSDASKISVTKCRFEHCGLDTFSGFPSISGEGIFDTDVEVADCTLLDCGGLYNEFAFGSGYRLNVYDDGQPTRCVILKNYSFDLLGTLPPEFAFAPITIFGRPSDEIPHRIRNTFLIKDNDLLTTMEGGDFDMPFGIFLLGQENGLVANNYIQASVQNLLFDTCENINEIDND